MEIESESNQELWLLYIFIVYMILTSGPINRWKNKKLIAVGFEPMTTGLQGWCCTSGLQSQSIPSYRKSSQCLAHLHAMTMHIAGIARSISFLQNFLGHVAFIDISHFRHDVWQCHLTYMLLYPTTPFKDSLF